MWNALDDLQKNRDFYRMTVGELEEEYEQHRAWVHSEFEAVNQEIAKCEQKLLSFAEIYTPDDLSNPAIKALIEKDKTATLAKLTELYNERDEWELADHTGGNVGTSLEKFLQTMGEWYEAEEEAERDTPLTFEEKQTRIEELDITGDLAFEHGEHILYFRLGQSKQEQRVPLSTNNHSS